tara:strand:+ start:516 stop:686 length:171 start_codon:yes stop_codon:yes gene_type:complete
MALENYVHELKKKHAKLSLEVDIEQRKKFPNSALLSTLKKEKLILKEKIVKKVKLL